MEVSRFLKTLAVAWSLAISQPWVAQEWEKLSWNSNRFSDWIEEVINQTWNKVYLAVISKDWKHIDTYTIYPQDYHWDKKQCIINLEWVETYVLDLEQGNNWINLASITSVRKEDPFKMSLKKYLSWDEDGECWDYEEVCLVGNKTLNEMKENLRKWNKCSSEWELIADLTS